MDESVPPARKEPRHRPNNVSPEVREERRKWMNGLRTELARRKELELQNPALHIGDAVLISGSHPYAGKRGIVAKMSDSAEAWLVKFEDNGNGSRNAFVFDRSELQRY
jgi:hypothetical protein